MAELLRRESFSLVEILIIIGIIGILVSIILPVFRIFEPDFQLSGTTRDLVSDFRYAQQLAVTEQVEHGVRFSILLEKYQLIRYVTPEEILKESELPSRVSFEKIEGFTNEEVKFNPYGAVKESGTVTLKNDRGKMTTIDVRPSGFIKILK